MTYKKTDKKEDIQTGRQIQTDRQFLIHESHLASNLVVETGLEVRLHIGNRDFVMWHLWPRATRHYCCQVQLYHLITTSPYSIKHRQCETQPKEPQERQTEGRHQYREKTYRLIHTRMHTCAHAYTHTHKHAHTHTCMHTCLHTHSHTHTHTHMHTEAQTSVKTGSSSGLL